MGVYSSDQSSQVQSLTLPPLSCTRMFPTVKPPQQENDKAFEPTYDL